MVMLETWLRESGVARQTFLISLVNVYRIITLPVSTLITPW